MGRLARVASDPRNAFASVIPETARAVLTASLGSLCDDVAQSAVYSWWDVNERTAFFRHPRTAKIVRRVVQLDSHQAVDIDPHETRKRRRRC